MGRLTLLYLVAKVTLLGLYCLYEFSVFFYRAHTFERPKMTNESVDINPNKHASSGKYTIEEYQDERGDWRHKIVYSRGKMDDLAKHRFLEEYRKFGRKGDACKAAGVTAQTVDGHVKNDPDFAEAVMAAQEEYHDKLIAHHQDLVFNGTQKETYDRNGNLVSTETIYPIRLIELELKKHDAGYRDKREVDVNVTGGVLVAPAEVESIEDWEARFGQKTIEGEIADGKSDSITEE